MNATVLVLGLAVVTVGSVPVALVHTLRHRGGPAPAGERVRRYLGVTLTPVGDRMLIIAGGFGGAVAVCEPIRRSAEPAPVGAASPPEPRPEDGHRTEPELVEIIRAPRSPLVADLSPTGRTTGR